MRPHLLLTAALALVVSVGFADDPTIKGSVQGDLTPRGSARFRAVARHSQGFSALRQVSIVLQLHGATLEEITYDIDGATVAVGDSQAVVGTGDSVRGRFFRISALNTRLSTGGQLATLSLSADVLEELPPEARFTFTAEDDEGAEASVPVAANVQTEDEGGLSIGSVALAVAAALLAGGFIGSRVTAGRRNRPSVYAAVQHRLAEERQGRPQPR